MASVRRNCRRRLKSAASFCGHHYLAKIHRIFIFSKQYKKELEMADHDELIAQFIEISGGDENVARFYLSSSNWSLEVRIKF